MNDSLKRSYDTAFPDKHPESDAGASIEVFKDLLIRFDSLNVTDCIRQYKDTIRGGGYSDVSTATFDVDRFERRLGLRRLKNGQWRDFQDVESEEGSHEGVQLVDVAVKKFRTHVMGSPKKFSKVSVARFRFGCLSRY